MKEKLKSLFTKNLWYKILAIVGGVAAWMLLMNSQDPQTQISINVPVTYVNQDLLQQNDKLVFLRGPQTVQIAVTVRNTEAQNVKPSDFVCKADLTKRSGGDINSQSVRVDVQQVGGDDIIIDWNYTRSDPYITVSMDNYISKEFAVEMLWNDDVSALKPEEVTFYPETVIISGPSSKFTNLASVKVPMTLSDLTQGVGGEFNTQVAVKLYDMNGEELRNASDFDFSQKTVGLSAKVANMKKINISQTGVPTGTLDESVYYVGTTLEPKTVTVLSLAPIEINEVQIPLAALNINNLNEDKTLSLDLMKYLPQGVYCAESDRWIAAKVDVEPYEKKTFTVTSLKYVGENENFVYKQDSVLTFTVAGIPADVQALSVTRFSPTVDVTDLEVGTHTLKVSLATVQGIRVIESGLEVTVTISETEAPTEPTEPSDETESTEA